MLYVICFRVLAYLCPSVPLVSVVGMVGCASASLFGGAWACARLMRASATTWRLPDFTDEVKSTSMPAAVVWTERVPMEEGTLPTALIARVA